VRGSSPGRLQRIVDVALPLLVGLWISATIWDETDFFLVGLLIGLPQGAALWWRHSKPELVMAIALVGGVVVHLIAPEGVFPYAGLVANFALAAGRPPRVSLVGLASLLGVTALNFFTAPTEDATFAMAFPVVAWALGEAARNRRAAIAEASRRAVGEEQARIARELHDVIAHSVSVIVVPAAAADDVFDEHPDQARTALHSIESAGREALGELRRLLNVVEPGAEGESRQPQPGLDRLGDLTAPLGAAGLDVAVSREGMDTAAPLSAGVDLCAYRIVQEALTNTLRHAGAQRVEVTVSRGDGVLEVDVLDDGRGRDPGAPNGGGRGITGMRERATMLGGTLEAGPEPGGGFRVHAQLPLEAAR
jgi:signal transduction histidine kinase